jgi:hypothetical protein
MIFILYNLSQIDDIKSYYEKDLQIYSNLTSIFDEKEITLFSKVMNNYRTKQCNV